LRGSRPVLGEADGEIPSVYLPRINCAFFQLLKEVNFRLLLHFSTAFVCGSFARHSSAASYNLTLFYSFHLPQSLCNSG
jgi:hypothetical protein